VFRNLETRRFVVALVRGRVEDGRSLLSRVHSSCVTSESWGGCDCDCVGQLDAALARIAREGRGVLFYLQQEGRGAGFAAKARDRMLVQASSQRLTTFEAYERMGLGGDQRRYEEVAFASRLLGLRAPLRLLTNNPEKRGALEAQKVAVESVQPLTESPSPFNLHYMVSKSRSGHALEQPGSDAAAAELPEPVETFEPQLLPGAPRFLKLASYLLPVRLGHEQGPCWFRVHVHYDLRTGREPVLLSYGGGVDAEPLLAVHGDPLLARFGDREAVADGWLETARRMVRCGAGHAVFEALGRGGEGVASPGCEDLPTADFDVGLDLLAHHAGGQPVRVRARLPEAAAALAAGLEARGLRVTSRDG